MPEVNDWAHLADDPYDPDSLFGWPPGAAPANHCREHNVCWTVPPEKCPHCDGDALLRDVLAGGDLLPWATADCDFCDGTGHAHPIVDGKY